MLFSTLLHFHMVGFFSKCIRVATHKKYDDFLLCSALVKHMGRAGSRAASLGKEKPGGSRASPGEGHQGDEGAGASLLPGGAGAAQPGEEGAQGDREIITGVLPRSS